MDEYIEKEALKQRLEASPLFSNFKAGGIFIKEGILDLVEKHPAADVVEVVRCKDCKHARKLVSGDYSCLVDQRIAHNETDYCSYGERREEK
jgi:hypothetical protein